jgi:hypothetical protein
MERHFDAFMHLANWGTRQLMFRVPRGLLDPETAEQYCHTDVASSRQTAEHVIIDLNVDPDEPDDDWDEPGAQLAAMVQVRSEIAAGDLRLLYLGWLLSVQWSEVDDDDVEPPVPAGLGQLSGALQAVADFLSIDTDLLSEAATASPATRNRSDGTGLTEWIDTLPGPEKSTLLARVVAGEGSYVQGLLLHRFRASRPAEAASHGRRTAGQLLDAAEDRREEQAFRQPAYHRKR